MQNRKVIAVVGIVVLLLIGAFIWKKQSENSTTETPTAASAPTSGASPVAAAAVPSSFAPSNKNPDLTTNDRGLSNATVAITTAKGVIKFKFYPKDAPNTVARIIQLINQEPKGFYNGLVFHRVVPGFVIQGGDPLGNGTGGSGQKLRAEFNDRPHVEGAVAMARSSDPDSADSQFYIALGTIPHLDHNYTVFGQVVEGMDVVKMIAVGDAMTNVRIE